MIERQSGVDLEELVQILRVGLIIWVRRQLQWIQHTRMVSVVVVAASSPMQSGNQADRPLHLGAAEQPASIRRNLIPSPESASE